MTQIHKKSLSNLQIELLKLYSNDINEQHLLEVKKLLGKYFAQKATEAMDDIWVKDKLTEIDMINWTNEHYRSPQNRS